MQETSNLQERPSPLQQAGIAQRDVFTGQLRIREIPDLGLLRLRFLAASPPHDTRTDSSLASAAPAADLPTATGQCDGTDPVYLCLGPNEWLVVTRSATPPWLLQLLRPTTGEEWAVAYDLTDGLVVLRLTGAAAPWLLSKLSCLDFPGGSTHGQHCARTRLGDVEVTVHYHKPVDEDWVFDLIADRSIAAYLWSLLQASAAHANELAQVSGVSV